jgi:hypothetical protein
LTAAGKLDRQRWLAAASRAGVGLRMEEAPAAPAGLPSLDAVQETVDRLVRRHGDVAAVVGLGHAGALTAARLAERQGLSYHPVEAVQSARSRLLARERFLSAGLAAPASFLASVGAGPEDALRCAPFPCVLKSPRFSGGRGVLRADTPDEFRHAFVRLQSLMGDPETGSILVESFIPGPEFSLEGVVVDGRLSSLALIDKPDPLDGPVFAESLFTTPSRQPPEAQAELERVAERAVSALGLTFGPVHTELRLSGSQAVVLEVAACPWPPPFSKLFRFENGRTLEELLLEGALVWKPARAVLDPPAAGLGLLPILSAGQFQGVDGWAGITAAEGVHEAGLLVEEGAGVLPLPEGGGSAGYLLVRGTDPAAVEQRLRSLMAGLTVRLTPATPTKARRAGDV